jgi:hypothetical protein
MVDFNPISKLLRLEPDITKHQKLENISGLRQVAGGCNRAVYRPIEETDSRHTDLHSPCPRVVYKVSRQSIPAFEKKKMEDCLKFLEDHYSLLRGIGSSKGLNIAPFSTELIPDKNGNLRVVYAEPDVGGIFRDPRIMDLAHANIHSNPEGVLSDDQALKSLSNIIDFSKEFHLITRKKGRPMYPDIWGEYNILGIKKALDVFREYSLNLNHFPQNYGYPLLGNSSLLKANDSNGLFNERPDFQLIISCVLDSMQRLIEQRALPLDPIHNILFQLAHIKTIVNKSGVNL